MREYTLEAKRFYKSTAWRKCRAAYIATVPGGLCEHCHDAMGYIVDHITEINSVNINDPDITLNHSNLQYLCLECHNTKTFRKHSAIREGYTFNHYGELVPMPPIKNNN